jgi:hypothetical protein
MRHDLIQAMLESNVYCFTAGARCRSATTAVLTQCWSCGMQEAGWRLFYIPVF